METQENNTQGEAQPQESKAQNKATLQYAMEIASRYGAKVMTPEQLEAYAKEVRSSAFPEFADPVKRKVQKITNIEPEEGEKMKDYVARAFEQLQEAKGNTVEEVEQMRNALEEKYQGRYAALEEKYKEQGASYEALQQEKNSILQQHEEERKRSMFAKLTNGADFGTGNSRSEALFKAQMESEFFETFDFRKDENGNLGVYNIAGKHFEFDALDPKAPMKDVSSIVAEFMDTFVEKYRPSNGSTKEERKRAVSETAQKERENKWIALCQARGISPLSQQAYVLKQEIPGYVLSENDKKMIEAYNRSKYM